MLLNNPHHTRSRNLVHFSARKTHNSCTRTSPTCAQIRSVIAGVRKVGCRWCSLVSPGLKITAAHTHSHTFMSFFRTPQNASILALSLALSPSVCRSSKGPPHSSVVLFKKKKKKKDPRTLGLKTRPCDKWLCCQTFVTGCPDMCKKKKDRLKTKQKILYPLSFSQRRRKWKHVGCLWNLSRCGASAAGALNFQLRWMQRDKRGGKKHYWAAQSQISYIEIQIDMRHHQSESCRIKKKRAYSLFATLAQKKVLFRQSSHSTGSIFKPHVSHLTHRHTHTRHRQHDGGKYPPTWWKSHTSGSERNQSKHEVDFYSFCWRFFFFFIFSETQVGMKCHVNARYKKKNNKKTKEL